MQNSIIKQRWPIRGVGTTSKVLSTIGQEAWQDEYGHRPLHGILMFSKSYPETEST